MVDAARQMLDELMGRNRNLHPSEAVRKISWDDPDFCQYYIVQFCPHDLFVNTRADLGPCPRLHDDEAKEMYVQARPSPRKKQYEDEFLRFCMTMLNDVDRKIQKGKQRLQLMNKDQPVQSLQSKFQEQVNNLNARINKLLSEAEEAGTRGDVDQAQDLMSLCEKLKEEKEAVLAQYEHHMSIKAKLSVGKPASPIPPLDVMSEAPIAPVVSPKIDNESKPPEYSEENIRKFSLENSAVAEKQMEVCETCGAFLIVGDAQQRIEDHLMGKQHLGYSKLRQAVEEFQAKRQKEREEEEKTRRDSREPRRSREPRERDSRESRESRDVENNRRRERDHHSRSHETRRRSRDRHASRRSSENHREQHKGKHSKRSRSRDHRRSHDRRSRSRSRY